MPVSFQGIRATSGIQVPQGGTGLSSIAQGEILVGNGSSAISTIPVGSDGQILTVVSGNWVAADAAAGSGGSGGGIASVTTSGNLQGSGTAGSPVTLKANISLTSVTASLKGDGSQITGLTAAQVSGIISSVSSSGNLQGDGTSGSALTLKDNISLTSVTASFSGSGAALTNIPNSALQNSSININGTDVPLGGLFTITVPQSGISVVNVSGSGISGSGIPGDPLYLSGITNDKLQNSSITINGSPISLGGSVTVADSSNMTFTGSGFTAGDVVALSGSLVKADYSDDTKSNAFGIVSSVSGTSVTVKVFGEVTALSASNYSTAGTLVYVGPSGSVVNYSSIPSGKYITQIGIISPSSGKVIIQPRIFGQKN